jgi:hypothetical protein
MGLERPAAGGEDDEDEDELEPHGPCIGRNERFEGIIP